MLKQTFEPESRDSEFEDAKLNISTKHKSTLLISVVIPVFNEEKSIKYVIEKIPNHYNYEIIIVDDGSTDNSVQKVKELGIDNIVILRHQKNLGYGAALITGFEHANGDLIVTMDSDGQHEPEDIEKIITPILKNKADVVIGSRYLGECNYKVPLRTRLGEYCIQICLLTLFGQRIGNNQSGYRCFKRDAIKSVHDIISVGMGFTTEFLFECALNDLRILEVPINLNSRTHGTSYVNIAEVFKVVLNCMITYYFKRINFKIKLPLINSLIEVFLKIMNKKNSRFYKL